MAKAKAMQNVPLDSFCQAPISCGSLQGALANKYMKNSFLQRAQGSQSYFFYREAEAKNKVTFLSSFLQNNINYYRITIETICTKYFSKRF